MKRHLSGTRLRVKRLAAGLALAGCPVCREDEARTVFHWVGLPGGKEREPAPESSTCCSCGRTYSIRVVAIGWKQGDPD